MSLEMRAGCERCERGLGWGDPAFICGYECTICAGCAMEMDHTCPNCGGELVRRHRRGAA